MTRRRAARRRLQPGEVSVSLLLEVLCSVHLSSYVLSDFKARGGFVLVGPPGHLKSTLCGALETYGDAHMFSDLNAQMLNRLKAKITAGSIRTIMVPEYQKLYERNPATASNVEGTLRAMVDEGFSSASFEDATIGRLKAYATMIGGVTPEFREKQSERWDASGFSRRFLWFLYQLQDPQMLDDSVLDQELINLNVAQLPRVPIKRTIRQSTTREERNALLETLKNQPGQPHTSQLSLMVKILAVMKWWRSERGYSPRTALHDLLIVARGFGKHGAELVL